MQTDSRRDAAVDDGSITAAEISLVRRIAGWAHKIYCGNDMKAVISIDDLYHTGIVGLLEARQEIDPEGNPQAYLAIRVRGAILDALRKQLQVRVPREQWRQAGLVRKAAEAIREDGEAATDMAISARLGWPVENVHKAQAVRLRMVQADPDRKQSDGDSTMPGEILADPSPTPEQSLLQGDLAKSIQECVEGIINRLDRIILVCRLEHRLELKMLARVMKFSIEGIRQKEMRARNQVKQCLESRGWTGDI